MTLIELLSKEQIENICSGWILSPEKIVIIGKEKIVSGLADRFKNVLKKKNPDIVVEGRQIEKDPAKSALQNIIDTLNAIIDREGDDCVIEYTGGDELYIAAAGALFAERGVKMFKYNFNNGISSVIDKNGETSTHIVSDMNIKDYIDIYGGCIKEATTAENCADPSDFMTDIEKMWDICRRYTLNYIDPKTKRRRYDNNWNNMISVLNAGSQRSGANKESLSLRINTKAVKNEFEKAKKPFFIDEDILNELYHAELLTDFSYGDAELILEFKNRQIKNSLTVAGRVLELKVFASALKAVDKKNGNGPAYSDVMSGVSIDWDGKLLDDYGSVNEIDVMMMRNFIPVFVSCKNGSFDAEELYKLTSVANLLGGKNAKRVLVATSLTDGDTDNYIRQRAKDMGIQLIEGAAMKNRFVPFANLESDVIETIMAGIITGANSGNTAKPVKEKNVKVKLTVG